MSAEATVLLALAVALSLAAEMALSVGRNMLRSTPRKAVTARSCLF